MILKTKLRKFVGKNIVVLKLKHIIRNDYLRDGRAPIPNNLTTSRVMSANKGKNTKPEILLRRFLWQSGIKGYRLHYNYVPGKPDICFVNKKLAVFVNGCFWHRCPYCKFSLPKTHKSFWKTKFEKNAERDKRKIRELKKLKWKVLVIWECQIEKNLELCIKKIVKKLNYESN